MTKGLLGQNVPVSTLYLNRLEADFFALRTIATTTYTVIDGVRTIVYRYCNIVMWSTYMSLLTEADSSDEKQDRSGKDTGCKGLRSG